MWLLVVSWSSYYWLGLSPSLGSLEGGAPFCIPSGFSQQLQYIPGSRHSFSYRHPGLAYRASTPFGATNLWPTSVTMSDYIRGPLRSMREFPIAYATSVWNRTCNSLTRAATLATVCRSLDLFLEIMGVIRKVCPGLMEDMTSNEDTTPTDLTWT